MTLAARASQHCRQSAYGGNPAASRAASASAKDWTRTTRPSRTVKRATTGLIDFELVRPADDVYDDRYLITSLIEPQ
jgi:hypothetical protein